MPGRPRDEPAAGRSATSGTTRSCTTTPTTWSRTTSSATSATSAPSGTATTPSRSVAKDKDGNPIYDPKTGLPELRPRRRRGTSSTATAGSESIPSEDKNIDFAKYGYKSLDELIHWRLYNRTGAGLMAELGSHQLDACSIFLGKKHPLAVTGIGGTFFYTDGREVDDHVFVDLRVPRQGRERPGRRDLFVDQHQLVRDYGEKVMGSKGTMIVEPGEGDPALQGGGQRRRPRGRRASRSRTPGKKPVIETSPSTAGPSAAAALGGLATADPSRGYREELEHFAYCVRHGDASNYHDDKEHQPRCRGEVALADAVIALTSNIAMRQKRRIEFDPKWFDYQSPEVPEGPRRPSPSGAEPECRSPGSSDEEVKPGTRRCEPIFVDGLPQNDVADKYGYTHGSMRQLVHQFRTAIRSDSPPPFSGAEGREAVALRCR